MFNVPLAARLSSAAGDMHVTRWLRDLSFSIVVPGGNAAATLVLDRSLAFGDPIIALLAKVYIYDGRNGQTLWEGDVDDPGRAASSDGEVWTVTATGPAAIPADDQIVVCYVDNSTESWQASALGVQTVQVASTEDDPPQVRVSFNNGTVIGANAGLAVSRIVEDCGQNIGRLKAIWAAGATDAAFTVQLRTRSTMGGASTAVASAAMNVAGGTLTAVATTDIASGDDIVDFRMNRTGVAATIGDDNHWISGQLIVQGTRYSAAGVELTAGATYSSDTVRASDVVADLLGRVLHRFDGASAQIDATSYAHDRLVYQDPTPISQILEDLMQLEPAYFWAGWESTSTGKYRFVWQAWPTTVRYEMSITDDFDSPGDGGSVVNRVLARYRDRNGRTRTVARTMAQADLDAAGVTRTASIDLGDEVGSKAAAQQAADAYLADHNSPANAGTITISRPILDLITGRMVQPWEVRPGNLIRVRGVQPHADALNATTRDGVTVFRLFSTEYRASTSTCLGGLDSYSRSTANEVFLAHRRLDRLRKR